MGLLKMVIHMRLFSCIGLLLITCMLSAQEKHALVIGIGEYQDSEWGHICGDEDIPYVEKLLEECGFEDRMILRNSEATKQAVCDAFKELAAKSSEGDMIYVHFSGHGQQMSDLDGDETDDEWDESWIPYDACRQFGPDDDGSRHLSDDEVNDFLHLIRGKVGRNGRILVVVDACHSGGSSRAQDDIDEAEWPSRGVSSKFVIPERKKARKTAAADEDWLIISACESYQRNFEVRKPRVGKLTYCMYMLRKSFPEMSNEGLIDALSEMMERPDMISPLPQNPVLEGDRDKYQFKDMFL